MRKQTKTQVESTLRRCGMWTGYLVLSRVAPCHIVGGWGVGYRIEATSVASFRQLVDNFTYHSCSTELGRYPAYYEVER